MAFTNAVNATLSVSYTYDANCSGVATIVDGTATTSYRRFTTGTQAGRRCRGSTAPTTWPGTSGQAGADAVLRRYGYDAADQLTSAVKASTDPTPVILKRYAYGYDPAGNRRFEQIDDAVTSWTYDALNRLMTQQGGGELRFAGMVSEPATVTVAGQPASVTAANAFSAGVPTTVGTNRVAVTTTDPSGNMATATYEIDVTENPKSFTYDANGNLNSDGTRTVDWDARNQLVALTVGTHRSEFADNGLRRRVQMGEKESGVTQADTRLVWCEDDICEERGADGVNVTRRPFTNGEQALGVVRLFTRQDGATVRVWHGQWRNASGAVVWYDIRYEPHAGAREQKSICQVTAIFFSATAAEAVRKSAVERLQRRQPGRNAAFLDLATGKKVAILY